MIRDNAIGHLRAAMKLEHVTITPAPITLIPAPSTSSTQTQYGRLRRMVMAAVNRRMRLTSALSARILTTFVAYRNEGLAAKSKDWINRASRVLWQCMGGEISRTTVTALREFTLEEYKSADSHPKMLSFTSAFLKHLAKAQGEPRYQTFAPCLELPTTVKARKSVTSRIVTKEYSAPPRG